MDDKIKYYDKLVRDKIPLIIIEQGKEVHATQAKGRELSGYMRKKLDEELTEFEENPSLDEAADVLEILNAYFINRTGQGIDSSFIRAVKNEKYNERGGFEKGIILDSVTEYEKE